MNKKDLVLEALEVLGLDATFDQVRDWLIKKYGKNDGDISDPTFYTMRKEYRKRLVAEEVATKPLQEAITEAVKEDLLQEKEITFTEMRKVANFVKEIGGIKRFAKIIDCLQEMQQLEADIGDMEK